MVLKKKNWNFSKFKRPKTSWILDNFITISKNTVTKKEMIDMENNVVSTLNFEILSPSILDFFQIYA